MKRLTFLLFCLLLGIGMANAQTTKVTGTVISAEDNEPIIGASIVVKGTTIGTVTDFNGAFSLDVPSSAKTLVVSFVGMKAQEIGVKPKVNVVLEGDNQMLDEVSLMVLPRKVLLQDLLQQLKARKSPLVKLRTLRML